MSFSTPDINTFWDISAQQPDSFSALPDDDFLAFLQKQFPSAMSPNPPLSFDNPDGVDPQSIGGFPPSNLSPPSSDSSPSPPSTHNESSLSRRQSGIFTDAPAAAGAESQDESSLKRKANDDNDDEPQHKSQHTSPGGTSSKKNAAANARRKPGAPQDESRLMKRKEQNRAAQRAFRERKEKHVRDLEDKVAALEAKNQLSEQENENLRDLLQRLQSENVMLKQAAFTFTSPRNNLNNDSNSAQPSFGNHSMQFNFSTPGAGPSKSPMQTQSPPSTYDINFNSLIAFDPSMLNPADELQDTNMDGSFSYNTNHYKTIASNPMFTSFAEPSPGDSPPYMMHSAQQYTPYSLDSNSDHWSPPDTGSQDTIDQLFGSSFLSANGTSGVDFQALLASPPSSLSPVSHTIRTPSLSSSSSSPGVNTASPSSALAPGVHHGTEECPKTKEQLSKMVAESGQSSFVQQSSFLGSSPSSNAGSPPPSTGDKSEAACEMPFAPFLRKTMAGEGGTPSILCRGSSFPKTLKSDKNVEVLTAWRTITSNPQFKDVDINELCTEFTNKARCDGTKVVLEPEGVHHIIETLAARQAKNSAKQ